jgi:hypothetical protein
MLTGCGVSDSPPAPELPVNPPDQEEPGSGQVDLVFAALSQYQPFFVNETGVVEVSVRNDGDLDAGAFSILANGFAAAAATYNSLGNVIAIEPDWSWEQRRDFDALEAGASSTFLLSFPLTNDATHTVATVSVTIDSEEMVAESNETNNSNLSPCQNSESEEDCSETGKPFGDAFSIIREPLADG